MELWSWVLSITGAVGIWLVGNASHGERLTGWVILLGSEFLWVAYALTTDQFGFVIGSLIWGAIYARNIARQQRSRPS